MSDSDSTHKISFETFTQAYAGKDYKTPTIQALNNIYERLGNNQIFGVNAISQMITCSHKAAQRLLSKLREMGVVVPVSGQGKGMYRFKNEGE